MFDLCMAVLVKFLKIEYNITQNDSVKCNASQCMVYND